MKIQESINREELKKMKEEFFNRVYNILQEGKIPADDLKANVSIEVDDIVLGEISLYYTATFSFILFYLDTPRSEFTKLSEKVEDLLTKELSTQTTEVLDISCVAYRDSEYTSEGYDAEIRIRLVTTDGVDRLVNAINTEEDNW